MEKINKNRLLLVGWVFGCILILGLICLTIIQITSANNLYASMMQDPRFSESDAQTIAELFSKVVEGYFWYAGWLLIWAISVSLNIIGWNKNNRVIILVAGIIYTLSLNIVSGILCFVAFAKLKKQTC